MKLAKQIGRIGKEIIYPLSPKEEKRAMQLHDESIVFDLHMHGVVMPEDIGNRGIYKEWTSTNRYEFAYEGISHAGITAYIDGFGSMAHSWVMPDTIREIGLRWCDLSRKYKGKVLKATCSDDVYRAKKEGQIAVFMTIENAELIGSNLDNIDLLYGLGVRGLSISYNKRNLLGDGRIERTDSGLSKLGLEAIKRMNKLGMIVDAAHSGVKTTLETIEASEAPIIISHSGAQGVFNTSRMATDEELKSLADKGGLVGIHSGPNVLSNNKKQGVEDMINHVDYIVNLIGVDHVAIGSDNYFGDKNALHHQSIADAPEDGLQTFLQFNCEYMEGIESPSEWRNITRALIKRGYSSEDIQKIIGGNSLKLLQTVIG